MKKLTITLILIILIFTSLLGYFYFYRSSKNTNGEVFNKITSLFPGSDSRNIIVDTLFPNSASTSTTNQTTANNTGSTNLTSKFQQISNNAVAGASFITTKATSTKNLPPETIWYIEKATGYVFSYHPDTAEQAQISNTTWIGGQETYWGENKNLPTFILRRSKNSAIENYLAKISQNSSSTNQLGELSGLIINPEIVSLASSPKKDRYFYLVPSSQGVLGYLGNFSGLGLPTQIFTSSYDKWQVTWPEENTVIFQSAPNSNQTGVVYSLNLKTKAFTRTLGGIPGLTAIASPDGKKILYTDKTLLLKVKRLDISSPDVTLGVSTLPEKCVWSKDSSKVYCATPNSIPFGNYPEVWYQGLVSFSDSFWEINTATGAGKQVYNPTSSTDKQLIDGINLFLNKKETKIFLTNKTDGTLWQLNLVDSFNNASSTINN